jgi:hypothetical protein
MPADRRRTTWWPLTLLIGLFSLLSLPVVLSGAGGTSEAADAFDYHLPIIERMRADWPRVEIVRYDSATTPGFHVLMAAAWTITGREGAMAGLNWLFGLGLVIAVFIALRAFAAPMHAAALTLPLACSPYVLGGSIWLTTDNAAMLFVVIALGSALASNPSSAWRLSGGLAAAAAVSIRQVSVWLAAPLALSGLIAGPLARRLPRVIRDERAETTPASGEAPSRAPLISGLLAASCPALVLFFFLWTWGWQLTPVTDSFEIHKHNAGPNRASPAFALALTGAFGVFFAPLAWRPLRRMRPDPAVIAAVLAALAAALATPTSHLVVSRTYGWLWRLVDLFPAIAERSIVITAAAPAGALILLALFRAACAAARGLQAAILLVSMAGWLAAQSMNSMAWQRYFEPAVILTLIWLGAMTRAADSGSAESMPSPGTPAPIPQSRNRWSLAGPLALAASQLALCAITLYREVLADFAH